MQHPRQRHVVRVARAAGALLQPVRLALARTEDVQRLRLFLAVAVQLYPLVHRLAGVRFGVVHDGRAALRHLGLVQGNAAAGALELLPLRAHA
ncbi:MAG TPA: hypothetical protein VLK84_24445, partial [Longimicrobium sp.]|nr:hypothetical protein [Longimicrobium sp.]